MIQKKVCMLGAFAVGKTSLVRRFVYSLFSEKYLTTMGVKIDKKVLSVGERPVTLILWDIHGDDEFAPMLPTYLRGMSGFVVVADGTRRHTLEKALEIAQRVTRDAGDVPSVFLVNKSDLKDQWEVAEETIASLRASGWRVIAASAKLGTGVEEAFRELTEKMLQG